MQAYAADRSLKGKIGRRWARLVARRDARVVLYRPMVSFSFDDVPASAVHAAAPILEAAGARGTFYISGGLADRSGPMGRYAGFAELAGLAARGHEIGCHTLTHLDCAKAAPDTVVADSAANVETLTAAGFETPTTFAWPYGDTSASSKRAMAGRFSMLRALHKGLIETGADLNQAPAVGIEGETGEAVATAWLDRAAARKAWLVLYSHDVQDDASQWGCTPAALSRLLARAQAAGFDVVTVAEGCRRIGAA